MRVAGMDELNILNERVNRMSGDLERLAIQFAALSRQMAELRRVVESASAAQPLDIMNAADAPPPQRVSVYATEGGAPRPR